MRRFVAVLSVATMSGVVVARAQPRALEFSCATFPPSTSEAELRARFGAANVVTAPVPWGGAEGEYNDGTVLFPSTGDARLEIFWRDRNEKRRPEWVSVHGKQSKWHTTGGISLGTDLLTIERLNRRPFRLLGFSNDVGGTVMSWSAGRLEMQDAIGCRVRMRLNPDEAAYNRLGFRVTRQVDGEREFSSAHPAMQALNPTVYEFFLAYARSDP